MNFEKLILQIYFQKTYNYQKYSYNRSIEKYTSVKVKLLSYEKSVSTDTSIDGGKFKIGIFKI